MPNPRSVSQPGPDAGDTATIVSKRADARAKVFQRAEVERQAVVTRGHILNLSAGGALVHSPAIPVAERRIGLRFAGMERRCTVVWRIGQQAGVRFLDKLSDGELRRAVEHEG